MNFSKAKESPDRKSKSCRQDRDPTLHYFQSLFIQKTLNHYHSPLQFDSIPFPPFNSLFLFVLAFSSCQPLLTPLFHHFCPFTLKFSIEESQVTHDSLWCVFFFYIIDVNIKLISESIMYIILKLDTKFNNWMLGNEYYNMHQLFQLKLQWICRA